MGRGAAVLNGHFYFKFLPNGIFDRSKAICYHCQLEFAYHRSTTSLKYHLKALHNVDASLPPTDTRAGTVVRSRKTAPCGKTLDKPTGEELTNALAAWIVKDSRPIAALEDAGLRRVLRIATKDGAYEPPTRRTVVQRIHKLLGTETSANAAALQHQPPEKALDFNHDELPEVGPFHQNPSNTNYVPDAVLPPGEPWLRGGPSRATLSLPSCLFLCGEPGSEMSGAGFSGDEQMGEMKVYAKCHLQEGVMFGPYVGELCREKMPTNLKYAWAIRDDAAFVYVDASDESKSNWMRYVTYTSREDGHNLVVFQFYRHIYYKVSQPIMEGGELRVCISKDYATLLGIEMGDNTKCEVGDKETFLGLLHDIQLVTLAEPSSSSIWGDRSQSQSPKLLISDVTTMSNADAASDSGMMAGPAFPSLISPASSQSFEKYEFMPGTERLLSNPSTTPTSPWYFFGFEPDPTGRPLDRCTAVCKLCVEHVGCGGGGAADLHNHLISKHHIRLPRDCIKERTFLPIGPQRSQPVMVNGSLVSTPPPVLSTHVTDAIANFLITDLQPPAVVEGHGFRQMINTFLPSCKTLPSPWQLESLLKSHHAKGKASLALLLRRKMGSGNNALASDYTAPVEFESRKRGRPPARQKEVPHFITLSADVWAHNWQGDTERYLTLWAHYIDHGFTFQNMALATRLLMAGGGKDYSPQAVEAQVKAMAQEWGISMPNLVLLGGEVRNKMRPGQPKRGKIGGAAESVPRPNSPTFLLREDAVSPEDPRGQEPGSSSERAPSVPSFFSAVRGCIEEVIAHSVVSKTLGHFQSALANLLVPPSQDKGLYRHHAQSLLQTLEKQEQAELRSWAHSRPTWNKLYPLLSVLLKHKGLFCDALGEVTSGGSPKEDAGSEPGLPGGWQASSTSNATAGFTALRSEWKVVEELCSVLKPLDVACRTLAKEAFPRLSLIKPILTGLLSRHLVSRTGDSSSILKEVKRMMRRNLASCYESPAVNQVLCVACALDPQFHGLGFMEVKERKATFDWLKKEAVRIVKEERRRSPGHRQRKRSPSPWSPEIEDDFIRRSKRLKDSRPINFREFADLDEDEEADEDEDVDAGPDDDAESDAVETDESEGGDPVPQGGLSGMEFLLGDLFCSAPKSKQSSVEVSVDMELSVFRADMGASLGVEPLQWWRTKAVQLPLLATVARAYLAAPAVEGSVAQDFAQEEALATYRKRANIPPESLDSILFLHHNQMVTTESGQKAMGNSDRTYVI